MNTNRWVVVLSISTFICLMALCAFLVMVIKPSRQIVKTNPYVMTVLPAPLITPQMDYLLFKTPTPETSDSLIDTKGISINSVVQIFNTDGAGLRLREGPGITLPVRFVALDSELFEISSGPEESDGYVWWYLVSPYDKDRSGWAASNYLEIIKQE